MLGISQRGAVGVSGAAIFFKTTYTPSWLFIGTVDLVYVHRALHYFMKSIDSLYSGKDQDLDFMKRYLI